MFSGTADGESSAFDNVLLLIAPPLTGSDMICEPCGAPFFCVSAAFSTDVSDVKPCNMLSCVVNPKMAMRVPLPTNSLLIAILRADRSFYVSACGNGVAARRVGGLIRS